MAPACEERGKAVRGGVFGLSALDDPRWREANERIKALLRKHKQGASSSGAKWLLRGPQGACLAAIIPGDSAAEAVVTTGLISFM